MDHLTSSLKKNHSNVSKIILAIIYCVGIIGFSIESISPIFTDLTKWTLILSATILFIYNGKIQTKQLIVFASIAIASYLVELFGVKTGIIFGEYQYGKALGIQFGNTPLLIGINWLLLSYAVASTTSSLRLSTNKKAFLGASIMVIFDIIMEQVAPCIDLWYWKNNHVPLQNYISWFVLALIFQQLLIRTATVKKNPLAFSIILYQFLFFAGLLVLQNL